MTFRQEPRKSSHVRPRHSNRMAFPWIEPLEARKLLSNAPIVVTKDEDFLQNPPVGTLRAAIITANNTPGPDTILFNLYGTNSGAHAITLKGALPAIEEAVFIDGFSEGGDGYSGRPLIRLDGSVITVAGPKVGLLFQDVQNSTVQGLAITGFDYGIKYDNSNTSGIADNTSTGNYVGLSTNGYTPIPNTAGGVLIYHSNGNHITQTVISGNGGSGLTVDHGSGNLFDGNWIGTSFNGAIAVGNQGPGINLTNGSSNNRIGTNGDGLDDPAEGNRVSANTGPGIVVLGVNSLGNSIRGNSIYGNGGIGIDLGFDGVTPNTIPSSQGPNHSQNFPVIASANTGSSPTLTGSLDTLPNSTFTLDFYSSSSPNAMLHGDGAHWLGSKTVTTDSIGNAVFTYPVPTTIDAGDWVTATATDANGNTSEFSQARLVNIATIAITHGNTATIAKDIDGIHADITANGVMNQLRISQLSNLTITGGVGSDTLTLDFSNGNPLPATGVSFDGGLGINSINIIGTSGDDTLNASATALAFTGGTFSNVPIAVANVQNLQFGGGTGGNDSINLTGGNYTLDADTPTGIPNVSVTVGAGTSVYFASDPHLANLTLNGGIANLSTTRHAMFLHGLSISSTGLLDIANGFLYLDHATTSLAAAKTYLDAGYNLHGVGNPNAPLAGDYNGLGGIISSVARASYASDLVIGLGYYDGALQDSTNPDSVGQLLGPNSDSGRGTGIAVNQILIRPTLTGDLNGDGVVNAYDVTIFNSFGLFNAGPTPLGWQAGDLNGDGVVDAKDVTVFNTAGNFIVGSFLPPAAVSVLGAKPASLLKPVVTTVLNPGPNLTASVIPTETPKATKRAVDHSRTSQRHSSRSRASRRFAAFSRKPRG